MSDQHAASEYSLWLVPAAGTPVYRQLQATITELADSRDDAPIFEPHVTVVGGIEETPARLEETTQTLAAQTAPIEVTFAGVRCSTTRHQCVFRMVDPSVELFSLRHSAVDALDLASEAYFPHLSLLYADLDVSQRLALADSIDTSALPDCVALTRLRLVETTGPVAEWDPITTVRL